MPFWMTGRIPFCLDRLSSPRSRRPEREGRRWCRRALLLGRDPAPFVCNLGIPRVTAWPLGIPRIPRSTPSCTTRSPRARCLSCTPHAPPCIPPAPPASPPAPPAPLLHPSCTLPAPLLHPSCTPPAPLLQVAVELSVDQEMVLFVSAVDRQDPNRNRQIVIRDRVPTPPRDR